MSDVMMDGVMMWVMSFEICTLVQLTTGEDGRGHRRDAEARKRRVQESFFARPGFE